MNHPQPPQQYATAPTLPQQPNAPTDPNNPPNPNVDEESDEYIHGYQPLDPRELTDAERLFMEYATTGNLEAMVDLWVKCKAKRLHSAGSGATSPTSANSNHQAMTASQSGNSPSTPQHLPKQPTIQLQTATNKSLSSLEIEIDCQDLWGSTPLQHASVRKHINVMKWLISQGADINKQDYRGITVLMELCWNNRLDMVKMGLVGKFGNTTPVDVNLTDERDYTALMQAAEEGHAQIVQLLIEARADLNKQEKKRSYTALMWAVVEGHPGVVQLLVNAGADLNIQDKYGFTALMQAARTRFLAAVLLLVGNGADLEVKDKKGRNVYDLGNQQVLQAIEKGKRELRRRYMQILSTDRQMSQWHPEILQTICTYISSG